MIKAMEDEHFNGKKIAPESANYKDSIMRYFQVELKNRLKIVRMRLTEFKTSSLFINDYNAVKSTTSKTDLTNISVITIKQNDYSST